MKVLLNLKLIFRAKPKIDCTSGKQASSYLDKLASSYFLACQTGIQAKRIRFFDTRTVHFSKISIWTVRNPREQTVAHDTEGQEFFELFTLDSI